MGRLLFALLLVALLALAGYSQYVNQTFFPENAMATALTPVKSFFSGAADYVTEYIATLELRGNLETEYNRQRALNEQLMYRALYAEELQLHNDHLLGLLGEYNARMPMNPLHARVIEREPGNWFSGFTLNKGAKDGVKINMAVVTATGMVGSVVEVFETTCKAITIIDSNFSVGGLIVSSRDQGVVSGTLGIDGQPLCRMYYLPASSVPRPGDTVVTSGVALLSSTDSESLLFPRGLPLGTVRESTRLLEENKYYVVVEPIADFRHIEDVLILRYEPTIGGRSGGGESVEQPAGPQPWAPSQDGATSQPLPIAPGRTTPSPEDDDLLWDYDGLPEDDWEPDDVISQPG